MILSFGWAVIQSSHKPYVGVNPFSDQAEDLDDEIAKRDTDLFDELESWLKIELNDWVVWRFSRALNNHTGLLQFHESRNHYAGSIVLHKLMPFIAQQSMGTHGLTYLHDEESKQPLTYQVWRILNGKISKHSDSLFSPFKSHHAFGGYADIWAPPTPDP